MIKKLKLLILLLFCCYPLICKAALDVVPGVKPGGVSNVKDYATRGGFHNSTDIGVRMTIYKKNGTKVSNSVDIVFAQEVYDRIMGYVKIDGLPLNTTKNKNISKVDYIKNNHSVTNWDRSSLANVLHVVTNHSSQSAVSSSGGIPSHLLSQNIEYYYKLDIEEWPSHIKSVLETCVEGKYSCSAGETYYAVFEPTMYVWALGYPMYGTAYELANAIMPAGDTSLYSCNNGCKANNLDGHLNKTLPLTLRISGKRENMEFYRNVGINEFCSSGSVCFGREKMYRSDILKKGIAIAVYDWTKHIEIKKQPQPLNCNVDVSINECGNSTIEEENRKNCIVGNDGAYSYLSSCNLYCSDTIRTDFGGLYETFIGDNKLNAIKSGQYISIKSNPKITITKTCYQSASSHECPDVAESFKQKLKTDYKTNNIVLTVDGNSYSFIGNPTIINNGYSSATITYEYNLPAINQSINIETMKGTDITEENKNKVIMNGTSMIITTRSSYGKYNYSLDVSSTPINKYLSSGSTLRNFKNHKNNTYQYNNVIDITYNSTDGSTKDSYSSNDLNYSCSYVKYNSEKQCICPENTVCNPVTCEPIIDDHCTTCDSECGCEDNITCDPIPCPSEPPSNPSGEVCDPETEVCFPNVIYRPISLVDPFPGMDGTNRDPGKNWDGIARDKNGNIIYQNGSISTLVDYYIKYNRGYDDYDLYREAEPLYVIKLDGNKIQAIREYNDYKKHNYNDFDLDCTDGEKCISKFLRGRADHFNINLIDSGTCKNINASTFDSCITRK